MLEKTRMEELDDLIRLLEGSGLGRGMEMLDQIACLLLIRDLERKADGTLCGDIFPEEISAGGRRVPGAHLRWSVFRMFPEEEQYRTVRDWAFPFMKGILESRDPSCMRGAVFKIAGPALLARILGLLDELEGLTKESFEYLLEKLCAGSGLCARVPAPVVQLMTGLTRPGPEDSICDPACRIPELLLAAAEQCEKEGRRPAHILKGYDMDPVLTRVGNAYLNRCGTAAVSLSCLDSLSEQNTDRSCCSLILSVPPFRGMTDYDMVSPDLQKGFRSKRTELLFPELFLRMLRPGGRCACLVSPDVLSGSSRSHRALRKEIVEENRLEAVIGLPAGVFLPFTGIRTALLVFSRCRDAGDRTDFVWFFELEAVGMSLDGRRTPAGENGIPAVIRKFHCREQEEDRDRSGKSFLVDREELAANGYDLSFGRYRESPVPPADYEEAEKLLAELKQMEKKVSAQIRKLEKMLGKQ